MKKIAIVFATLLITLSIYAQQPNNTPAYLRFPTMPPFTLLKPDSTELKRDDLPKGRKLLFMYFSPTCEHCQHQTKDMLSEIEKLKDVQILMATYQPFDEMKKFYADYKIANYKNISMGRDRAFFFPPFYKMNNLPYLALYDAKGNLITTFDGNRSMEVIVKAFEK